MNHDHDSQRLDESSARNRRHYVRQAQTWTRQQAERLKATEAEILSAIKRGWLPEHIEAVSSRYHLESLPPALPDVPVHVDHRIAQTAAAGDTAVGVAFRKARAA